MLILVLFLSRQISACVILILVTIHSSQLIQVHGKPATLLGVGESKLVAVSTTVADDVQQRRIASDVTDDVISDFTDDVISRNVIAGNPTRVLYQQLFNRKAFPNDRIVVSSEIPTVPPFSLSVQGDSSQVDLARFRSQHRRSRRSSTSGRPPFSNHSSRRSADDVMVPACESVSEWVQLTEAEDLWNNRVKILQNFDNGSTRVNQYFWETRCTGTARQRTSVAASGAGSSLPQCTGIDSSRYESFCTERYSWMYGRVYDNVRQTESWTFVKIKVSCNCGLIRKSHHGRASK